MAGSNASKTSGRKSAAGNKVAPRRDFEALRQRRLTAAKMFARGKRQAQVAAALGVSAQTASRWYQSWLAEGRKGLAGAGRAGRTRKLSNQQLRQVDAALGQGAKAHGFATDLWTLERVAEVIERITGVRHGLTQTWVILRERLRWTRQRPARQAVERNGEAIARWVKEDWPRIKKTRGAGGPGSSSKTRADSR